MTSKQQFDRDPRSYTLEMVEEQLLSADRLLLCCLKYMSHEDVRGMLDANELSPRFDEDDEFELTDEDEVRDAFWEESGLEDDRDDEKTQNDYNAEIRTAFVDWLDDAHRDGRISDDLAGEVTL